MLRKYLFLRKASPIDMGNTLRRYLLPSKNLIYCLNIIIPSTMTSIAKPLVGVNWEDDNRLIAAYRIEPSRKCGGARQASSDCEVLVRRPAVLTRDQSLISSFLCSCLCPWRTCLRCHLLLFHQEVARARLAVVSQKQLHQKPPLFVESLFQWCWL